MALIKDVRLANGVAVGYHRIVSLNIVTNECNVIELASYVDADGRAEQARAMAALREEVEAGGDGSESAPCEAFMATAYYSAPYDQSMTVESAYAWLKSNVDALAGAEDDE